MGCQTGFYLSSMNSVTAEDIAAALIRVYNNVFPIHSTEDIVGLNEIQCGNPYLYDIEGTNAAMEKYINLLNNR
jgi:S-ribosylhomocysteine lyase LuxS involved in autoinducer biosynthesis